METVPAAEQHLTEAMETLAEVKELVSHTAVLLAEAEETEATVLQITVSRQDSIDSNGGKSKLSVDVNGPVLPTSDRAVGYAFPA
ncbi:MAG: hypothetical protein M3457_19465 [Chloroflexota bacterium]|nr:hypothetical protein [Chloroflexota bacterium]